MYKKKKSTKSVFVCYGAIFFLKKKKSIVNYLPRWFYIKKIKNYILQAVFKNKSKAVKLLIEIFFFFFFFLKVILTEKLREEKNKIYITHFLMHSDQNKTSWRVTRGSEFIMLCIKRK